MYNMFQHTFLEKTKRGVLNMKISTCNFNLSFLSCC